MCLRSDQSQHYKVRERWRFLILADSSCIFASINISLSNTKAPITMPILRNALFMLVFRLVSHLFGCPINQWLNEWKFHYFFGWARVGRRVMADVTLAKIIIMTSNRHICGFKWHFEIDLLSVCCFDLYLIAMIILEWNVRVNKSKEFELAMLTVMLQVWVFRSVWWYDEDLFPSITDLIIESLS